MEKCLNCGKEVQAEGMRNKKFCCDDCRYKYHNQKRKKWTIKKMAKHYRETREFLPEAEEAQEIHLMTIAEKIENKYNSFLTLTDSGFLIDLEDMIDIEIGLWQANHGFILPYSKKEFQCET